MQSVTTFSARPSARPSAQTHKKAWENINDKKERAGDTKTDGPVTKSDVSEFTAVKPIGDQSDLESESAVKAHHSLARTPSAAWVQPNDKAPASDTETDGTVTKSVVSQLTEVMTFNLSDSEGELDDIAPCNSARNRVEAWVDNK